VNRFLEEDVVKVFTTNGFNESINERLQAGPMRSSAYNLQLGHHRLVQQINRLLEPLILDECRISLFRCLDRSMAEQMLNVSDGSTSTQQTSGESLSQVV